MVEQTPLNRYLSEDIAKKAGTICSSMEALISLCVSSKENLVSIAEVIGMQADDLLHTVETASHNMGFVAPRRSGRKYPLGSND